MESKSVAVVFMNGIGNFIFFTAAIKILKTWGYDVTLITDEHFLSSPALREISKGIFKDIRSDYKPEEYFQTFIGSWSVPVFIREHSNYLNPRFSVINWVGSGIHEVQHYIDTIGASWEDYEGYIFDPIETFFEADPDKTTIVLSNCATINRFEKLNIGDKRKKRWKYFPELSKQLINLGYEVILVGLNNELEGCEGVSFVDKLSVKETGDVIKKCDLLIAPSTGNTVIADVVGTPVLLLEGPMQTARAHPINVPFSIVRNYISCAPCFQKSTWEICRTPVCMDNIRVSDVLIKMHKMLRKTNDVARIYIHKPIEFPLEENIKCESKVAYLVSCFNRYHILKNFLESFEKSNLPDGTVFFLNDASQDPRIQGLLDDFSMVNVGKEILIRDLLEKMHTFNDYKVNPSIHAFNKLLKHLFALVSTGTSFDYVVFIDPDIIMKQNWVQKMIQLYDQLISDLKIGIVTPFNTDHLKYDGEDVSETQNSEVGDYRIRNGSNLPYMISYSFLKNVHGLFSLFGKKSMDIGKSSELDQKGYKTLVTVPSLVEHFGAYGNTFLETKPVITSLDYYGDLNFNE